MPWKETVPMEQRLRFMLGCEDEPTSHAEQCRRFGISRKTGYKWRERYTLYGLTGAHERSRARLTQAHRISDAMAQELLEVKLRHLDWGPKKVRDWFLLKRPSLDTPAASTIGELFERHGLVKPRSKRRRSPPYTQPFMTCVEPNDVWSADFKGQFKMGNGRWCYPFTLTDNCSRYLLACQGGYDTSLQGVRRSLDHAFREFGLPLAIRTDNGTPFASNGLAGLSQLSVWLIRLNVIPERIPPGRPAQNGRHERMHRSMKAAMACAGIKMDMASQQRWFNQYRQSFNEERPHEALDGKTPGYVHKLSSRHYTGHVPDIEYPDTATVRRVRTTGAIKWQGKLVFISNALKGEQVSLTQEEETRWCIRFGPVVLGYWDDVRKQVVRPEIP